MQTEQRLKNEISLLLADLNEKEEEIDDLTQHITRLRNEIWRLKNGRHESQRKDGRGSGTETQDTRRTENAEQPGGFSVATVLGARRRGAMCNFDEISVTEMTKEDINRLVDMNEMNKTLGTTVDNLWTLIHQKNVRIQLLEDTLATNDIEIPCGK